ncbi:MAG: endopygalactorunase [Chitinophagaceae bacterium]|nr:endopygalactorunase [Chitinophagaceae bacterium]
MRIRKSASFLITAFISSSLPALAQKQIASGIVITAAAGALHIVRITSDSIVLAAGSTYRYTVDTPEDSGLVSTGASVTTLQSELRSASEPGLQFAFTDKSGAGKTQGLIVTGDRLLASAGGLSKEYFIAVTPMALGGRLWLKQKAITANTVTDLKLYFTAGQRSPDAAVDIHIPKGISVTMDNTAVNVIGRGTVKLSELSSQSIGRTGTHYSYSKVGQVVIQKTSDGGSLLQFSHLDLRPANGPDLEIVIHGVNLKPGAFNFNAAYRVSQPQVLASAGTAGETAQLSVTPTVADFERVIDRSLRYTEAPAATVSFRWLSETGTDVALQQSADGQIWTAASAVVDTRKKTATVTGLTPGSMYRFRLDVRSGTVKGKSNIAAYYAGKLDLIAFGVKADGVTDNTDQINGAISMLAEAGGGTLLFSDGIYNVRTLHLQNNVYLFIGRNAVVRCIRGGDAPEATWFSDKKYRSGLSPTDRGPYEDPENWLTKQDVGHHYFANSMFFGERIDNVKIIGNGLITGNGNIVTGDNVMRNAPDNRTDKLITCKLCTNLEIGGLFRSEDLWYDSTRDIPYYRGRSGKKDFDTDNMLKIDRGGHFALLSTGTDYINVHDTYFGRDNTSNVRDIYDFMGSNHVTATNIYCKVSSDDIIKPGSDCSLGFTRPARDYKVRNIIGDTNCNLFQIGSETADDIMDICVDNIYVLGANKAGFSISTNDGAHIKNIHLNCGETGPLHSRSRMFRATAPFFISISNRGRIIGADVGKYAFMENGLKRDELLVKNVNIGQVENIVLNAIDVAEVYSGSSFSSKKRWAEYDGSQRRATSIIAGYALPDPAVVTGGLDFRLPDGRHVGYIRNVKFNDVHITDKGGNPLSDTSATPPELGVGQYNVSNLKTQPAYGIWARHVKDLYITNSSFGFEKKDGRYPFFLDDVIGAVLNNIKVYTTTANDEPIKMKNSQDLRIAGVIAVKE